MPKEDDDRIIRELREKGTVACLSLAELHDDNPVPRIAKKRRCAGCGASLNHYNGSRYCAVCRKKKKRR